MKDLFIDVRRQSEVGKVLRYKHVGMGAFGRHWSDVVGKRFAIGARLRSAVAKRTLYLAYHAALTWSTLVLKNIV